MSAGPNMWILKTNDQNQKVGFLPLIHQHFSFAPIKRKAGHTSQLFLLNGDFTPILLVACIFLFLGRGDIYWCQISVASIPGFGPVLLWLFDKVYSWKRSESWITEWVFWCVWKLQGLVDPWTSYTHVDGEGRCFSEGWCPYHLVCGLD